MAAASDNHLYRSEDGGLTFRTAAILKDETISHVTFDPDSESTVYLAGSRHGYRIDDVTRRIFTAGEGETIHTLIRHEARVYAGTSAGLYASDATLLNWQAVAGLRNEAVYAVQPYGRDLFIAGGSGVYLYRPDGTLERLFVARGSGDGDGVTPCQISVDPMTPSRLRLCTSKGVYASDDRGRSWRKMFLSRAGNASAYCIAQFPLDAKHFYLCNEAGLFKVDSDSGESTPLFSGLPSANVRWAEISMAGAIYVATDQGLFKNIPDSPSHTVMKSGLEAVMKDEPSIHEVQEAAMRYNSVDPDKTGRWRRRLKYRALFPKLDVDFDKTIGASYTSAGYYYGEGPNDWGISLTWDVGDLIWNSYEDDIDNRTKLTTQLRLDILDEVNRLYFERLRLKHEIANAVSGTEESLLRQFRLYELTATLDGYTGGLYSQ
jgi:hypothetical protein